MDFDIERIVDGKWYELLRFDLFEESPAACSFFQFTRDSDKIYSEYSYYNPDFEGEHNLSNYILTPLREFFCSCVCK